MENRKYPPPTGGFYAPVRLEGLLGYVVNELNAWPKGQRHILLEQLSGETRELAENHLRFLEGREHEGEAEPPRRPVPAPRAAAGYANPCSAAVTNARRPAPQPEPEAEDDDLPPDETADQAPPSPMPACLALDLVEQAKAIMEQLPGSEGEPPKRADLDALLNCSMDLARTCHERIALQE